MNEFQDQLLTLEPTDDLLAMKSSGGGDGWSFHSLISIAC